MKKGHNLVINLATGKSERVSITSKDLEGIKKHEDHQKQRAAKMVKKQKQREKLMKKLDITEDDLKLLNG